MRFFLLIVASLAGCPAWAAADSERPNILWITCEDTSPTLGCYGDRYATTPNLDRLARQGVRYTHAFTVAGVCAPSRSCLITGMYPSSLGSHHMRCTATLPPTVRPFPAYLRAAGYYCSNNVKTDYNFAVPEGTWDESSRRAHWRNRRPGQTFFSVFNHNGTHESRIRAPFERTDHDPLMAVPPPFLPNTPVVRRDWARYHDLVTAMDGEVGRLLSELEEDGLADDTIVFFFSDHGVGLPRAKQWIWDAGLRVPLLVRFPAKYRRLAPAEAGAAVDRLVSFVDFAPTVLSLAGIRAPDHLQGTAFLGKHAGRPREYIFAIRDRMDERYDMQRAVRDRRYKYFRNYMPYLPYAPWLDYMELLPTMREWRRLDAGGKLTGPPALFMQSTKPVEELYDIEVDPHELHNLAGSPRHQDVLRRMRKVHRQWVRETKDLGLLPEQELRRRSAGAAEYDLARRGDEAFPVERLLDAANLVGAGVEAVARMRAALADRDAGVRFWAAQALINLGPAAEPAVADVLKATTDGAPEVRIAAAHALCNLGRAEDALPVLLSALSGDEEWARLAAANVLDRIGPKAAPAVDAMRRAAADEGPGNRYVRWVLLHALRELEKTPKP